MKKFCLIIFALLLLLPFRLEAGHLEDIAARGTIRIGTTGDYIVHYTFTCEEDHNIELTVGDINLDGSVTNKDSLILDRKLAKWKGYDDKIKVKTLADLNRDENITNKDSLVLNRYLAKWKGYDKYIIKISYNDTVVI